LQDFREKEFQQEEAKERAIKNISKAINNAVDRIDTIVNPQRWAKLPCFAGETPVWTIDGVKRIKTPTGIDGISYYKFCVTLVLKASLIWETACLKLSILSWCSF
jgi:hypothetical protein